MMTLHVLFPLFSNSVFILQVEIKKSAPYYLQNSREESHCKTTIISQIAHQSHFPSYHCYRMSQENREMKKDQLM